MGASPGSCAVNHGASSIMVHGKAPSECSRVMEGASRRKKSSGNLTRAGFATGSSCRSESGSSRWQERSLRRTPALLLPAGRHHRFLQCHISTPLPCQQGPRSGRCMRVTASSSWPEPDRLRSSEPPRTDRGVSLWVQFPVGRPTRIDLSASDRDAEDLKRRLWERHPDMLRQQRSTYDVALRRPVAGGGYELVWEDAQLDDLAYGNSAAAPIRVEFLNAEAQLVTEVPRGWDPSAAAASSSLDSSALFFRSPPPGDASPSSGSSPTVEDSGSGRPSWQGSSPEWTGGGGGDRVEERESRVRAGQNGSAALGGGWGGVGEGEGGGAAVSSLESVVGGREMRANGGLNRAVAAEDISWLAPVFGPSDVQANPATTAQEEEDSLLSMGLQEDLLEVGVQCYGFKEPSEVLQLGVGPIARGMDVLIRAPFSLDRTVAHCAGCLQRLHETGFAKKVVILGPTKEVAQMVERVVVNLGVMLKVQVALCVGELGIDYDERDVAAAHVVVGTADCVMEAMESGVLRGESVGTLVVEEVDELMGEGSGLLESDEARPTLRRFQREMFGIFRLLGSKPQVCLLSAGYPTPVLQFARKATARPVPILATGRGRMFGGTFGGIAAQHWVRVEGSDGSRVAEVHALCDSEAYAKRVVCVQSREQVVSLVEALGERGEGVVVVHGGMDAVDVSMAIRRFRLGDGRLMVTSCPLPLSLCEKEKLLVVNYDVPREPRRYLGRLGCLGWFGRGAVVVSLVRSGDDDEAALRAVETYYGVTITEYGQSMSNDAYAEVKPFWGA